MNHFYRLVRSADGTRYVPVPETAKAAGKASKAVASVSVLLGLVAAGGNAWAQVPPANALPTGGQVVAGQAQIAQNGNQMTVTQGSDKLITNWQGFNIGQGSTVNFAQPSSSSVALNRVLGNDASQIYGSLTANGKVFLVNPNGVLFGQGAQVDVGGLVASTLNIKDSDFLAGNYVFSAQSGTEGQSVRNLGTLRAHDGGAIALLGGKVSNDGIIEARLGTVALAAGGQVTLDFAGDGLLNVKVDKAALDALVDNRGAIRANGGSVLLTANAGEALLQTVVNNTGLIEAQTLGEKDGKIVLLGSFDGGSVQVGGTLDASAPSGGNGGFIETSGAHVNVADSAKVTTQAAEGKTGKWLIDPNDFTIADSGGNMSSTAVAAAIASNDFEIQTATMGSAGGNGDIHVNSAVRLTGNNTLTLTAERNININASITVEGTSGGLALNYGGNNGNSSTTPAADTRYTANAPVNLTGANARLSINGNAYSIVRSMADLLAIDSIGLGGRYALALDLDASGAIYTSALIGKTAAFTGHFAGLGHTISDLVIDAGSGNQVGLFGATANGSSVRNLGLLRGSVSTTGNEVGSLVGSNRGTLDNVYATGSVSGNGNVGGLVGSNAGGLTNAFATGDVTGNSSVGGLVGYMEAPIVNVHASGNVLGNFDVGGLVGFIQSHLTNGYATGNVSGNGSVGGLAGNVLSGSVKNGYATGSVTSSMTVDAYLGGLVGQLRLASLENVYATGSVTHPVATPSYAGGLVGRTESGTITNGYWDSASTGQASAVGTGGGTAGAITASDRYNRASYAGFGTWSLVSGTSNVYAASNGGVQWIMIEGQTRPFLASEYSTTIRNAHQLQLMAYNLGARYTLAEDIDASATSGSNASDMWSSAGFVPVGDNANRFNGQLDGAQHVVNRLTINRGNLTDTGLFGYTGSTSVISNIGLEGGSVRSGSSQVGSLVGTNLGSIRNAWSSARVQGGQGVGGLVGTNWGSIVSSYASGTVTSDGSSAGGLVGVNSYGTIYSAYATGSVSGTNSAGGLVGLNTGTLDNVYASGQVVSSGTNVGGLFGMSTDGSIRNAYWDAGSTGRGTSGSNAGSSVQAFAINSSNRYSLASYAGFGTWAPLRSGSSVYVATDGRGQQWVMIDGSTRPMLASEYSTTIHNAHQLQLMAYAPDRSYSLANDIDASATSGSNTSEIWSTAGFSSVGTTADSFGGSLDGRGHTISGLGIDRSASDNIGLFGVTSAGSVIRNLGLADVNIKGGSNVGGLAGSSKSTISNSYVTGSITGTVVRTGGMVGANQGSISNAYTTARVTGNSLVGGLAGYNQGSIINTYANGTVSGTGSLGGLVGDNDFGSGLGSVFNSFYATTDASGADINAGLNLNSYGTGKTWQELSQASTFVNWSIASNGGSNAVWRIYEGVGGPLLRGFLQRVNITTDGGSTNKTYDGSTAAGAASYTSDLGSELDTDKLLGSLGYVTSSKNVGTYSTGNGSLTLAGLYSGQQGYDISYRSQAASVTVNKATISAVNGITASNKTYDGASTATLNTGSAGFTGMVTGDNLSVDAANGSFADKNAADGKTVHITGITLAGADAGNYTLANDSTTTTADITKATISAVTGITASNKTYDGTSTATLDTGSTAFTGRLGNDDLSVSSADGAFVDKNAADGKTVNISNLVLGGTDAGNYTLATTTTTTTADIAKASISAVTGITAQDRTYDGTSDASLGTGNAAFTGRFGNDQLSVASASGSFANKNAGDGKTVSISNIVLGGADAGNYTLVNTSGTATASIAKASISAVTGITAQNRTYDGTTDVNLNYDVTGFSGLLGNDELSVTSASGAFANKNAGDGKTVHITGITLGGNDAGNYTLANDSATATANIAKATISAVSGITGDNKTYDGTRTATLNTGSAGFTGMVAGDSLSVGAASGSFADKNAADGKTVHITGITLGGNDAGNYTLANDSATTTADIAKAMISAVTGVTGNNKTYDGTSTATLNTGSAGFSGMVAGDSLSVGSASGSFADKNAGDDKTVHITGITLAGNDAGNYTLASSSATTTADIAKANAVITANSASVDYNGQQQSVSGYTVSGLVNNETASVITNLVAGGGTGTTAGTYVHTVSGGNADNYALSYVDGALTIAGSPAPLVSVDHVLPGVLGSVQAQEESVAGRESRAALGQSDDLGSRKSLSETKQPYTIVRSGIRLPEDF
ncbi:YDG domain-containing protein [Comamonas terrigena]|uniref:YDG domain-containing protein n=1 Tax=Comamonas terrigena TaxID=32013 RepID=UPI0024480E61|nr:YDG domain-containing protein [Comamonas terrigena]MDH1701931.1 YDG domain-containing protein [Comamonas terrigena]